MLLSPPDVALYFKLHRTLMFFVNQRLRVIPDDLTTPQQLAALSPETRLKVRDALLDHTDLIPSFVHENPAHLPDNELAIVRSWQHLVAGRFYIFRELKEYTAYLSTDKQPIAYGVLALSQSFEELIGPYLPVLVQTVLLPFKDMIVYDGILNSYRISFGPGIRRSLNESFKEAKERHGIVTSLPMSATAMTTAITPKAKPHRKAKPQEESADVLKVITGMIDQFCNEHLNDEYAFLCRKLAEKLARKRPSPLTRGKPETWACAIVRVIGWVNYLEDRSQPLHRTLTSIDQAFGVAESTGNAKAKAIRDMLKIRPLDPNWILPSQAGKRPAGWLIHAARKGFLPLLPEEPAGEDDPKST